MSSPRFSDDFKRDAVHQVVERRYPVAEVSQRLLIQTAKSTNGRGSDCKLSPEAQEFLDRQDEDDRMVMLAGSCYREIELLWEHENSHIVMTKSLAALRSLVKKAGG